jgi:tetratricopeptide (TPR) repeat protein
MGRKPLPNSLSKRKPTSPAAHRPRFTVAEWIVVAALVVLTFAVFGQVGSHQFINYDDGQFIFDNSHVGQGLTAASIDWALTKAEIGYYPLTWLSHELDVTLWGIRPGAHLLTNVLFHAITACLLFFALLTLFSRGSVEPPALGNASSGVPSGNRTLMYVAAFTAALFAVHPMHVESVAWASERKDTLSTLLIAIGLLLYARAPRRWLGVALAMAASLAAKQMYVTFPFVLLLLDYWPLDRLRAPADLKRCVLEKLPLFALAIAGSGAAVIGQRNLHAMQTKAGMSIANRLANATVAYSRYLGKLFVPFDLAIPYPLISFPPVAVLGATLLLLALSAAAVAFRNRAPYLVTGWLWFLGTLVPVIGIVALGAQSMADRYSYFSYIGLFFAIAFGALTLPIPRRALAAAGMVIVLVSAVIAFHQTGYWRDSETLFTHSIAVTPPNGVAEYSLGQALELTKPDASIAHLHRALALTNEAAGSRLDAMPDWYTEIYVGLGTALLMKARQEPDLATRVAVIHDAQTQLVTALKIDPKAPHAMNNLAFAQAMLAQAAAGKPARSEYDLAINRGVTLHNRDDFAGAIAAFRQAVDLQPRSVAAQIYLARESNRRESGQRLHHEGAAHAARPRQPRHDDHAGGGTVRGLNCVRRKSAVTARCGIRSSNLSTAMRVRARRVSRAPKCRRLMSIVARMV